MTLNSKVKNAKRGAIWGEHVVPWKFTQLG